MEDQQVGLGPGVSAPGPDWYESQDGDFRWWDGEKWGPVAPLPAPGQTYDVNAKTRTVDDSEAAAFEESVNQTRRRNPLGIVSVCLGLFAGLLLGSPTPVPATIVFFALLGLIFGTFGVGLLRYLGLAKVREISYSKASAIWGLAISGGALVAFLSGLSTSSK